MALQSQQVDAPIRLSCRSQPFYKRPSFVPTLMTVSGIWLTVVLLCLAALHKMSTYGAVALLLALSAALIGAYLAHFTYRWMLELTRTHILELSDRAITYKIRQRLLRAKTIIMRVPYSQLEFVDNFAPRSYALLVLHMKGGRVVTVPTWSMTMEPGPILAFLAEKHVPIVHV